MRTVTVCSLGRTRYADTWKLQQQVFDLRRLGLVGDVLLLNEHDHVYTIGKGGNDNHLLASDEELTRGGVDVFHIDRGGDITYHGPGQLVGYPILDLNTYGTDIHRYLRNLEEVLIRALRDFGIEGAREQGMTGVWVRGEKIAALGVKVSRWITMHGFALNVNTDLSKFGRIIPCGIFHKGVTSMECVLGGAVSMEAVARSVAEAFEEVFECRTVTMTSEHLRTIVSSHAPAESPTP